MEKLAISSNLLTKSKKVVISWCLLLCLLFVLVSPSAFAGENVQWEYKVIETQLFNRNNIEAAMNKNGTEGWELVSFTYAGKFYYLIYKRPKK